MRSTLVWMTLALTVVACAAPPPTALRPSARPAASSLDPSKRPDVFAELAARPLATPPADADGCPVSSTKEIDDRVAPAIGDGPIFVVLGTDDGVWPLQGQPRGAFGLYQLKALWISTDPADERLLLRIFGFDPEAPTPGFAHGVVFAEPRGVGTQLRLGPEGSVTFGPGPMPDGWRAWSSGPLVPGPGCYAFQVDTERGTEHLLFEVTP